MNYAPYQQCYERCTRALRGKERVIRALACVETVFVFAFVAAYLFFSGYTLITQGISLQTLLPTVLLPGGCFGCVSLLQTLVARPRPYQETGANIQPLRAKDSQNNSFPSRHTASAFVIGMVTLSACPWAGIACFAAGLYIAIVRFLFGVHYPSDLLAGAILGVLFGVFAFL